MLKAHRLIFLISKDEGRTWERIPEEYIQGENIDMAYFWEQLVKAREALGCESCLESSECEMKMGLRLGHIQYCVN